jgi:hypothetical protein
MNPGTIVFFADIDLARGGFRCAADVVIRADGQEASAGDGYGLGARSAGILGEDVGVVENQLGIGARGAAQRNGAYAGDKRAARWGCLHSGNQEVLYQWGARAMRTPAMSRVVRGGFPDRQFDVDFWQQQGDEATF